MDVGIMSLLEMYDDDEDELCELVGGLPTNHTIPRLSTMLYVNPTGIAVGSRLM